VNSGNWTFQIPQVSNESIKGLRVSSKNLLRCVLVLFSSTRLSFKYSVRIYSDQEGWSENVSAAVCSLAKYVKTFSKISEDLQLASTIGFHGRNRPLFSRMFHGVSLLNIK
jgi:hypothetical protein